MSKTKGKTMNYAEAAKLVVRYAALASEKIQSLE